MACCWLCEYAGSKEAAGLTKFFVDNAGCMKPAQMAIVAHEALLEMAPGAPGTKAEEVLAHITEHTLHPSIRVAGILRHLLDMSERVSGTTMVEDEDGRTVVDPKAIAVYMKLASEIMSVYRSGKTDNLTFSDCDRLKALGAGGVRGLDAD